MLNHEKGENAYKITDIEVTMIDRHFGAEHKSLAAAVACFDERCRTLNSDRIMTGMIRLYLLDETSGRIGFAFISINGNELFLTTPK